MLSPDLKIYSVPLQGLTEYMFREAHSLVIGGVDRYFSPYVRVEKGKPDRPSRIKDLEPSINLNQNPIPQFLGNTVEDLHFFCNWLDSKNYGEVNINLGCPYPMVTRRKMGAGLLSHPQIIKELFDFLTLKGITFSVKCRLGDSHSDELLNLVPLFNDYPIEEVIIHPRIAKQLYKGVINWEEFLKVREKLTIPVGYNGDINSIEDFNNIYEKTGPNNSWSLGRGLLANPLLAKEIKGHTFAPGERNTLLNEFHNHLSEAYLKRYQQESIALQRITEFWSYFYVQFPENKKLFKQIKKAKNYQEFTRIVSFAFDKI